MPKQTETLSVTAIFKLWIVQRANDWQWFMISTELNSTALSLDVLCIYLCKHGGSIVNFIETIAIIYSYCCVLCMITGFWAFLWFVCFCFLANQWQCTTPDELPLNQGADAARAAITFSFFSIFTWVNEHNLYTEMKTHFIVILCDRHSFSNLKLKWQDMQNTVHFSCYIMIYLIDISLLYILVSLLRGRGNI